MILVFHVEVILSMKICLQAEYHKSAHRNICLSTCVRGLRAVGIHVLSCKRRVDDFPLSFSCYHYFDYRPCFREFAAGPFEFVAVLVQYDRYLFRSVVDYFWVAMHIW